MPRSGFTAPGQREIIARGERTDPRVVIGQAAAYAAVGTVLVLLVMWIVMVNVKSWTWDYTIRNWRWLIIFPLLPILAACVEAILVLRTEINDPNWPNPRDATQSTRPLHPLSKERMQPKGGVSFNLKFTDLLDALNLELDDDEEEGDYDDAD